MTGTPQRRGRAQKQLRVISIVLLPFGLLIVAYSIYLATQPGSRWIWLLLLGLVFVSQTFILRRFIAKNPVEPDSPTEQAAESHPPTQ